MQGTVGLKALVRALAADGCPARGRWQAAQVRAYAAAEESSSWIPSWLRSKLPGFAGGTKKAEPVAQELTLDGFKSYLQRARQVGAVTGFVGGGSSLSSPKARALLRTYEDIIGNMTEAEKSDLKLFGPESRQRAAVAARCSVSEVNACINKYAYTQKASQLAEKLQKQGKEVPKTFEGMAALMGESYPEYRSKLRGDIRGGEDASGRVAVPQDAMHRRTGEPCPLAGRTAAAAGQQ
ncbi:hypothetical protein WJX81_004836 [Elliptochloris bilobata]|uniref:Uncharacterized protein n=1 Tax=Elliptochloris bilobata TaxID=381761 RepID=A0AAW1QKC1_9CHLO